MKPDVAAMRAARDEADELLGVALSIIGEDPQAATTPAQLERTHVLAQSYVQLAGAALERFQEALNGS